MKEVDPEVARLLEDLPKTKLPPALDKEGWGQFSMRDHERMTGKKPEAPKNVQQPTYTATCHQCARPLTSRRGRWVDHSGNDDCDGGAVAEREFTFHVVENEIEFTRDFMARTKERAAARTAELEKRRRAAEAMKAKKDAAAAQPCQASRGSRACQHKCMEPRADHFGFHHCRYCGKLWG